MDCRQQAGLDLVVFVAKQDLERRDHVADDVFRRVVQHHRHMAIGREVGRREAKDVVDEQGVLGDRKALAPTVWPFQRATRARPWAMSEISMSRGEGSIRSSRRPDSIRCQARGGAFG